MTEYEYWIRFMVSLGDWANNNNAEISIMTNNGTITLTFYKQEKAVSCSFTSGFLKTCKEKQVDQELKEAFKELLDELM